MRELSPKKRNLSSNKDKCIFIDGEASKGIDTDESHEDTKWSPHRVAPHPAIDSDDYAMSSS